MVLKFLDVLILNEDGTKANMLIRTQDILSIVDNSEWRTILYKDPITEEVFNMNVVDTFEEILRNLK